MLNSSIDFSVTGVAKWIFLICAHFDRLFEVIAYLIGKLHGWWWRKEVVVRDLTTTKCVKNALFSHRKNGL